jgi:hypothetical protein
MIRNIKQKVINIIYSAMTNRLEESNTQIEQAIIANQYRLMKNMLTLAEMPSFKDVGFKVHSQFEEDGILLYIFSLIGATNKRVVEICAGNGITCMAANLIINHGWEGLLFDGDRNNVEYGIKYYSKIQSTKLYPPIFKQAWITRDNVNQFISENGFNGDIDLLSLDIDGNDYYIMEAINVIKPRVIICETHDAIPSSKALTIPYKSDFNRMKNLHPEFMGVSLLGMKNLLNKKGYRLIGSHRYGFNAIFMINDIGQIYFPEVNVEDIHDNSYTIKCRDKVWKEVKDLPWVKVEK